MIPIAWLAPESNLARFEAVNPRAYGMPKARATSNQTLADGRAIARSLTELGTGPAQALQSSDVTMITICFYTQNATDEIRYDLGRQVNGGSSDAGDRVDDCRFEDINSRVCEVPRRVIDLFMETHHGAAIIKLQDAAGPGVVGPKA